MKELELNNEQLARNDEIYNAALEFCKVLCNKPELEYDMGLLGPVVDAAVDFLAKQEIPIYFPAILTNPDGTQEVEIYVDYEPYKEGFIATDTLLWVDEPGKKDIFLKFKGVDMYSGLLVFCDLYSKEVVRYDRDWFVGKKIFIKKPDFKRVDDIKNCTRIGVYFYATNSFGKTSVYQIAGVNLHKSSCIQLRDIKTENFFDVELPWFKEREISFVSPAVCGDRYLVFVDDTYVRDAQMYLGDTKKNIHGDAQNEKWKDVEGSICIIDRRATSEEQIKKQLERLYPDADPKIFRIEKITNDSYHIIHQLLHLKLEKFPEYQHLTEESQEQLLNLAHRRYDNGLKAGLNPDYALQEAIEVIEKEDYLHD